MTYDEWAPMYRKLAKTYNKTESGEQCAAHFEALRDLRTSDVERAVTAVLQASEYFPVPAKIREQVTAMKVAASRQEFQLPNYEPISDEKRAELLAVIRQAKEKIFGRSL
jgi:hypothetical protein